MKIVTIIFCLFLSMSALGQTANTARVDSSKKYSDYVMTVLKDKRDSNVKVIPNVPPGHVLIISPTPIGSVVTDTPLIVVDGKIDKGGLTNLNPDNIESIIVLKNKGATDVYGAAGKNGVLLITMKHHTMIDPSKTDTAKREIKE